jgi:NTE family protein
MHRIYALLAGVVISSSSTFPFQSRALAQEPDAAIESPARPRPKIGLALSGGGARGGAHIGVLLALRDLRVPIDYVAGTSMGAVIGGLFASGLSEEDLEQKVAEIVWQDVFAERPSRDDRSFHRKQDDQLYLVNFQPGFNDGGLQLPAGLVQGQGIDLLLTELTVGASAINEFDELPIPYRAITADIVNGEAVVLSRGSLSRAIRASLSIPGVIAPVEIDGRLLVDGGIAMNLPVEVVRAMGADIVIAIDIGTPLHEREEITSVVTIASQLTGLLTRRGTQAQIDKLMPRDVLIVPSLGDLSAMDFDRIMETLAPGYQATMAAASTLAGLALSEDDYVAHRSSRTAPAPQAPIVEFVRVNDESRVPDALVEARASAIPTGVPFDIEATQAAIAKIHGLGLYQNVRYALVEDGARTGLEIDAEERSWGPNYLQIGLEYSAAGDEERRFGIGLSYLRTAVNAGGAELRSSLSLGDEQSLSTVLHQPFGPSALFFVAPELERENSLVSVFDGDVRIAEAQVRERRLSVSAGREIDTWGEFRIGLSRGSGDVEVQVGDPTVSELNFDVGELFARFTLDTLDNVYFPSGGSRLALEWRTSRESLGAGDEYDQVALHAVTAKTFGQHTLVGSVRYESTIEGEAPIHALPELGGFFDLSGYSARQLTGQNAGRLLGAYYRRIGNFARMPIYAGITLEAGNVWDARDEISLDNSRGGGSIWIGADTLVGPLYLGYGRAEGGAESFYFYVGRVL